MECTLKKNLFMVIFGVLVLNLQMLLIVCGEPQVPCYFIFGDSLVDNGNNNDLDTAAKVNYPPYGIDFPNGPTGRFSNGRNIADVIAELLGFEDYIPPFATAKGQEILNGVNYGSGSAGIRDDSGEHMGAHISLDGQLRNHEVTISRLALLLGSNELAKEHLSKCIYTVGMGNNDYINNYFMPEFYSSGYTYTPEQYATSLIEQYSKQLRKLYELGAKKMGIFGLGAVGCTPFEMAKYGTNESSACVTMIGDAVQLFNDKLQQLIVELNDNLVDAEFISIDQTPADDPTAFGLTVLTTPCCKPSNSSGKGQCARNEVPCVNRNEYVYWDEFHPTDATNALLGFVAYTVLSPFYASSINILEPKLADKYVKSV